MKSDKNGEHVSGVFAPKTTECLRKAGWQPERKIDTGHLEALFREESLELLPKAQSFLREFGELIVPYQNPSQQQDTLDFVVEELVQGLGAGALQSYEKIVGQGTLCPIGRFAFGQCLLMMDQNGKVYGGLDWKVTTVGQSGYQAIDNIITGREIEIVSGEPPLRVTPRPLSRLKKEPT